jgi:hypothetical protein
MMMRGVTAEGIEREPLARAVVRGITLTALAGLAMIARRLIFLAQGYAPGFG